VCDKIQTLIKSVLIIVLMGQKAMAKTLIIARQKAWPLPNSSIN